MKAKVFRLRTLLILVTSSILFLFFQNCSKLQFSDAQNESSLASSIDEVPLTCSVLSETQGDMLVTLARESGDFYNLSFGTLANNYWKSAQYDRQMSFGISDFSKIEEFVFNLAAFDDWLWVKVNGETVYIGPYDDKGIESIELKGTKTSTNVGEFNGELSISWKKTLSIDLLPYLKQGKNTIWTRTIVQGKGENFINMHLKQHCEN